ncbi:MAG: NAD-glutamate dehydrogenase [Gammaproteobacteria bacterium]|jgi:glutamate dehydrogenase|nr:NAD-glutamate dehydrogenase [Gammaproteobacteria bacterium]MBT5223764.1 NAD-glutamate dehydrogenase [Gammaproteobacteria bacterium]MBT5825780.1 NAD-glutamate dehydrogenase [Gammaproteobacteria bacterium]MBT6419463.1 NAD-glutamate dehydrogenase [Gammaproteobacteria bacterium]MBT6574643.1 NAD-glutamate dehydrogenase [Gammaproteobacteria bacterium]
MGYKNIDSMLDAVTQYIRSEIKDQSVEQLTLFARQYFSFNAFDETANISVEDLYGAVLSHWNLFLYLPDGKVKMHLYNPSVEEYGWQSSHTVIEVVSPDQAFILQSITMEINRYGFVNQLVFHPVYWVHRDKLGKLLEISKTEFSGAVQESVLHIEINRQSDDKLIKQLKNSLQKILIDVCAATEDWSASLLRMESAISTLTAQKNCDLKESIEFLQWLKDDHFVFLGYREYRIIEQDQAYGFSVIENTGLGILRDSIASISEANFLPMSDDAYQLLNNDNPLLITKATSKAKVQRPVFMDYIGIKQYDAAGLVSGEIRFLGLYSSSAYSCELNSIPLVRSKMKALLQQSEFVNSSHTERALLFVINSLPRDELFQANLDDLSECVTGVLQLQERQRVRVFVRHEVYSHFVSLLVFVPRERYNTGSRIKIQEILLEIFQGSDLDFSVTLSESILARIHFIIHSKVKYCIDYDVKEIEQRIISSLSNWHDELEDELHFQYGEAEANSYLQAYKHGFSAAYREAVSARTALLDLKRLEQIERNNLSVLGFLYSPLTASGQKQLYFKLYCFGHIASLSRSLPMLENMGVKVCSEHPYEINKHNQNEPFWIHDFGLTYAYVDQLNLEVLKPRFQEAFEQCWLGRVENDGFNALVISASLSWQDINILRALYFYLRQIGITFSQSYVECTLVNNTSVVTLLINLFYQRFSCNSENENTVAQESEQLTADIEMQIDQVKSLDEDRILRRYLNLILAAERSNFFKNAVDEQGVPYLSIKFNSARVNEIPSPVPYYEVFVYSPRMEGIHIRGGAVARGGLRWSDRREDFRTEVLGLMKAQMTKNSVIVPTGAKGGFVVKSVTTKEAMATEGVACYRLLIRGLLDITDNYAVNDVIKPELVNCYDQDDPYLVVAADKGTASFSDYANELSLHYNYWLGDAFASGGSAGYDHKKMGITARGAWVSVQHHFASLGIDIQKKTFSVVGIGSMEGDVFGNGLLLSNKIKLIAAFNHESIFLDPNPHAENSFQERQRLFHLIKSKWTDYQPGFISKGGGVYSRHDKTVILSNEIKEALAINQTQLTPNELIKAILSAPVDLLWNGGIGTYVKADAELNSEVGDRVNDSLRINGGQLRCKIVAEGGNLGFTQLGRIEYALHGGCINTDSIDNSAGVDCSDHEVNIKILLNNLVLQGDLTAKQRDKLLESMTDQVADLVLSNNHQQNHAISMIQQESNIELSGLKQLIITLESRANLDCVLEKLPNNKVLQARKISGKGMTRPEISVLLAYTKQLLKTDLLSESRCINLNLYQHVLVGYFPTQLHSAYAEQIQQHRLGKEIVANQLINSLVNRLGIVFPHRFMQELNCSVAELVNTYNLVCRVFEIDTIWKMQNEQESNVSAQVREEIKLNIRRWVERAMYWFVHNESKDELAEHYVTSIEELDQGLSGLITKTEQKMLYQAVDKLIQSGVSASLALKIAQSDALFACLNAIKVQKKSKYSLAEVTKGLFFQAEVLNLYWLYQQILVLPKESTWEALSRRSMIEEFNQVSCVLLQCVLAEEEHNITSKLEAWQKNNSATFERYMALVQTLQADDSVELEKIVVILGASWNLTIYGN